VARELAERLGLGSLWRVWLNRLRRLLRFLDNATAPERLFLKARSEFLELYPAR
jgi:hypothetical protein